MTLSLFSLLVGVPPQVVMVQGINLACLHLTEGKVQLFSLLSLMEVARTQLDDIVCLMSHCYF